MRLLGARGGILLGRVICGEAGVGGSSKRKEIRTNVSEASTASTTRFIRIYYLLHHVTYEYGIARTYS
jgi:hypothetical protein